MSFSAFGFPQVIFGDTIDNYLDMVSCIFGYPKIIKQLTENPATNLETQIGRGDALFRRKHFYGSYPQG
jgi:hypothetical protein